MPSAKQVALLKATIHGTFLFFLTVPFHVKQTVPTFAKNVIPSAKRPNLWLYRLCPMYGELKKTKNVNLLKKNKRSGIVLCKVISHLNFITKTSTQMTLTTWRHRKEGSLQTAVLARLTDGKHLFLYFHLSGAHGAAKVREARGMGIRTGICPCIY